MQIQLNKPNYIFLVQLGGDTRKTLVDEHIAREIKLPASNLKNSTSFRISEPPPKKKSYVVWVFLSICAPQGPSPLRRSLSPLVFEVARCPRSSAVGHPECPTWSDIIPFRIPSPGISWDKRIPNTLRVLTISLKNPGILGNFDGFQIGVKTILSPRIYEITTWASLAREWGWLHR